MEVLENGSMVAYINSEDIPEFNRKVKRWGDKVKNDLNSCVAYLKQDESVQVRHSESYVSIGDSLRTTVKKNHGLAQRVSISFTQHGVFWHYGVGRGRPIGSHTEGVDWFNPVMKSHMDELANIVAEFNSGIVVNLSKSLILESSKASNRRYKAGDRAANDNSIAAYKAATGR